MPDLLPTQPRLLRHLLDPECLPGVEALAHLVPGFGTELRKLQPLWRNPSIDRGLVRLTVGGLFLRWHSEGVPALRTLLASGAVSATEASTQGWALDRARKRFVEAGVRPRVLRMAA